MAEYFKTPNTKIDNVFYDYFYLNNLFNYEELLIIDNKDFDKLKIDISNITIFENINKDNCINDDNPIYLNLKLLNNAKLIYLKENINVLNDENIISFISSFRGKILCNKELVTYLKRINLINEEYNLNKNTYLKIDKYGVVNTINIL